MKIPLIWLSDYVDTKKSPQEIAKSFTALGLMLDKNINDKVLDLEHRMDRSDWLSIIGCARDFAAFEGAKLKYPKINEAPGKAPKNSEVVDIKIECPDLVNRFNTRVFRGIKVGPSPDWIKERLEAYGIPSINNIVDITNYVMVEFGQPMHAQDLAKMKKREIVIRRAKDREELTTLLGETVELDTNCFVLTQEGEATVLGGIVGTPKTSVDENTTEIVLDAGNYNQVNIRKNSRKLKIQNETVLRYDKILHPRLTEIALERATFLIKEFAGGEYFTNIDYYPRSFPENKMWLRYERLKQISGLDINPTRVEATLEALEYKIIAKKESSLQVLVPYFRTDVEVEDDIVSDVLRINNYENIPTALISQVPPKNITPAIYTFEDKLRDLLCNLGLHEHIIDPLELPDSDNDKQIKLENSFSYDHSALRTSAKGSFKTIIETYKKHKLAVIPLFEIGMVYTKEGKSDKLENYRETRFCHVYYEEQSLKPAETSLKIKGLLAGVTEALEIPNLTVIKDENIWKIYSTSTFLGELGYNYFILYTVPLHKVAFPINKNRIVNVIHNYRTADLSFILDLGQSFGDTYNFIKNFHPDIKNVTVTGQYTDDKLGKDKKSILVKVTYENEFPTIKAELLSKISEKFKVQIRE